MPRAKKIHIPERSLPTGSKARLLWVLAMRFHHRAWIDLEDVIKEIKTSADTDIRAPDATTGKALPYMKALRDAKFVERHPHRKDEWRATARGRQAAAQVQQYH